MVPNSTTIRRIIEKFVQNGSVETVETLKRRCHRWSAENIALVNESEHIELHASNSDKESYALLQVSSGATASANRLTA